MWGSRRKNLRSAVTSAQAGRWDLDIPSFSTPLVLDVQKFMHMKFLISSWFTFIGLPIIRVGMKLIGLEGFPGQKSPYYIRIEVHECFDTISLPLTLFHSISPHFTLPYFGAGVKWDDGEWNGVMWNESIWWEQRPEQWTGVKWSELEWRMIAGSELFQWCADSLSFLFTPLHSKYVTREIITRHHHCVCDLDNLYLGISLT